MTEAILRPLIGHHPVYVFTYEAKKTRQGRVEGSATRSPAKA